MPNLEIGIIVLYQKSGIKSSVMIAAIKGEPLRLCALNGSVTLQVSVYKRTESLPLQCFGFKRFVHRFDVLLYCCICEFFNRQAHAFAAVEHFCINGSGMAALTFVRFFMCCAPLSLNSLQPKYSDKMDGYFGFISSPQGLPGTHAVVPETPASGKGAGLALRISVRYQDRR